MIVDTDKLISASREWSTIFMTSEQVAEWNNAWSLLSIEEYFRIKAEALQSSDSARRRAAEEAPTPIQIAEDVEVHIKAISKTRLTDGKLSILVDLGSRINIIGEETYAAFKNKSIAAGFPVEVKEREQQLTVNGVGSDAAFCTQEATITTAVQFADQAATTVPYTANIARGCGSTLPAIMGLQSMQEKDAVLLTRPGHEMMAFPGPGGYKIEWSPGTMLLPMTGAPSGHLVIPSDRYEELTSGASSSSEVALFTDYRRPTEDNAGASTGGSK